MEDYYVINQADVSFT